MTSKDNIPVNYSEKLLQLRGSLGLTQVQMAERLGVSFASVNRWENGNSKPSRLAWAKVERLLRESDSKTSESSEQQHSVVQEAATSQGGQWIDFTGNPEELKGTR